MVGVKITTGKKSKDNVFQPVVKLVIIVLRAVPRTVPLDMIQELEENMDGTFPTYHTIW